MANKGYFTGVFNNCGSFRVIRSSMGLFTLKSRFGMAALEFTQDKRFENGLDPPPIARVLVLSGVLLSLEADLSWEW